MLITLREVQYAAVKWIDGPNLPCVWMDHQPVRLRGVEINPAVQDEAVEDEREAPSGDRVGLVKKAEMQVGPSEGPVFPSFAMGAPACTPSPIFTTHRRWRCGTSPHHTRTA